MLPDVAATPDIPGHRITDIIGSWSYRGHVTGISVSYTGIPSKAGLTTPWEPHFQIDDVGYTS